MSSSSFRQPRLGRGQLPPSPGSDAGLARGGGGGRLDTTHSHLAREKGVWRQTASNIKVGCSCDVLSC